MNSVEKDTNVVEKYDPKDAAEPTAGHDVPLAAAGDDDTADTAGAGIADPGTNDNPVAAEAGAGDAETGKKAAPDDQKTDVGVTPSPDEPALVEDTFQPSVEEELEALKDRVMRQAAEFQNYRRRTEQEKARMMEFGKAFVVQQLLDVVDDFERSLDAARAVGTDPDSEGAAQAFSALSDGVGLVYAKLKDALSRAGVEEIESVGRPFDEHEHEAMMQQPAAEGQEPGIVVGEILKGYRMGERVLRHARVIVSA